MHFSFPTNPWRRLRKHHPAAHEAALLGAELADARFQLMQAQTAAAAAEQRAAAAEAREEASRRHAAAVGQESRLRAEERDAALEQANAFLAAQTTAAGEMAALRAEAAHREALHAELREHAVQAGRLARQACLFGTRAAVYAQLLRVAAGCTTWWSHKAGMWSHVQVRAERDEARNLAAALQLQVESTQERLQTEIARRAMDAAAAAAARGGRGGEAAEWSQRAQVLAAQNSTLKATAARLSRALATFLQHVPAVGGAGKAARGDGEWRAGREPGCMAEVLQQLAATEALLGQS